MEIQVDFDKPVVRGALTLFPVLAGDAPGVEYIPGPTAAGLGLFDVTERADGAVVPELIITNRAERPLLLIEGEVLRGAKQNRTLNVTVLCHPGGETVIPVSCVEAGRWGWSRKGSRSRFHAGLELRAAKMKSVLESVRARRGKRSDQGSVWDSIERYASRLKVSSPTFAFDEIQESAAPGIDELLEGLVPAPGQCGVLVGIGGRAAALDVFDSPNTLAAYWESLLAGYASDALFVKEATTPADDARAFVACLAQATGTEVAGAGLGVERHFGSHDLAGMELRLGEAVIHLSAFATLRNDDEGEGEGEGEEEEEIA